MSSLVPDEEGRAAGAGEGLPAAASDGALEISIGSFEGPLDLLLHLVRANDMDIMDIPVVQIARQYNLYLDRMRDLDLEIASEYLVMAATLAHIKSRLLLPPDPDEEGEGAEDPRAELTRQLLEYEKFKKAAEELAALESRQDLVFARPGPPPPELAGAVTIQADLSDLVRAFERILRRLEAGESAYVVRREDVKVQDMMERLVGLLDRDGTFSFAEVLASSRTRLERVVLFLALLELVRLGSIAVYQPSWRDDIRVERIAVEEAPA